MPGKWKLKFGLILLFLCFMQRDVFAYSGKGTAANPYGISNESDLKTIMTSKGKSGWVYVEVQSNITLTKSITVGEGKFRIYATGKKRKIQRSTDQNAGINKKGTPKYCFKIGNDATVDFGYGKTEELLELNGNEASFSKQVKSSGMMYIEAGCTVIISKNCILNEIKNNKEDVESSPIYCAGTLQLKGEIKNCSGMNGGAMYVDQSGMAEILSGGKIHHCSAETEGGAICVGSDGHFYMRGGEIYQCNAKEEGGAVFIYDGAYGGIETGKIYRNSAGKTGGGIFSGMGAQLEIGTENSGTAEPVISENTAGGSGGGIRCNGGVDGESGGITRIYRGVIQNNQSGSNGGGISCGGTSNKMLSKLRIEKATISGNIAENNGGGLWLGQDIRGLYGEVVEITSCRIGGNQSGKNGGAIRNSSSIKLFENVIEKNKAGSQGGGLYLDEYSCCETDSGTISGNAAGGKGAGIYLKGKLKITRNATVHTNNRVYLRSGTFVEIIGALNRNNHMIASLESEDQSNGTRLVKVSYQGGTGAKELYVSGKMEDEYGENVATKKFQIVGVKNQQCLRPTEYVAGFNNQWIIISEKYQIQYNKNTGEAVEQMPQGQVKYWNEETQVSKKEISRPGYQTVTDKHWNTMENGKGTVYLPGKVILDNQNLLLYAQWEIIRPKNLFVNAPNRYYVVGQKIKLDNREVLKKILVEDDLKSGKKYEIEVREIRDGNQKVLAQGEFLEAEQYISTEKEQEFVLTIMAKDSEGTLQKSGYFRVVILEMHEIEHPIRFISKDYLYTLSGHSKWVGRCNQLLQSGFDRNEATQIIRLNTMDIKEIKESVKNHQYQITKNMNRQVMERYGGQQ